MESDFSAAVALILAAEGGYVNDPNDPGGETNFGISRRQYPDLDIRALTRDQATVIYKRDYWTPVRGDSIPWPLCAYVFDAAVNQGVFPAIKMLQRALDTVQDGLLGPVTLSLAEKSRPWHAHRYMALRVKRYMGTRHFDRFGEGWLIRLFHLASKAPT